MLAAAKWRRLSAARAHRRASMRGIEMRDALSAPIWHHHHRGAAAVAPRARTHEVASYLCMLAAACK